MIPSYLFSVLIVFTHICSSLAVDQIPLEDPTLGEIDFVPLDPPCHDIGIAHLNIDFSTPEAANITNDLLRNITSHSAQYPVELIRNITVIGYSGHGNWPLVNKVFDKVLNLETVYWHNDKAIPSHILRSLERNSPSCRLYYTLHFSRRGNIMSSLFNGRSLGLLDLVENLWTEFKAWKDGRESVMNSKNLYSLKVNIMYAATDNFHDMATVFDIVASSPNLKELDLHLDRFGCILAQTAWSFNFRSHPFTRFPPLEVVRLNGYAFDDGPGGSFAWSWLDLLALVTDILPREERIARNDTNLDAWMKRMDWSYVHTLEISRPSEHVLNILQGGALPSLKNLVVSSEFNSYDRNKVMDFITKTAQPLESLSLIRFDLDSADTFISDANLRRELKSFTLRPNLENTSPIPGNMLHNLLATSPKLESVDVAIERQPNIAWHESPYKEFIYCPTLRHLTLRFPSPDGPNLDYTSWAKDDTDPLINNKTTVEIFKTLRQLKNGAELESMQFYVGDWENRDLVAFGHRGDLRAAFYSCFIDRGEEKCEGTQVRQR
jgi:hypothetical protein